MPRNIYFFYFFFLLARLIWRQRQELLPFTPNVWETWNCNARRGIKGTLGVAIKGGLEMGVWAWETWQKNHLGRPERKGIANVMLGRKIILICSWLVAWDIINGVGRNVACGCFAKVHLCLCWAQCCPAAGGLFSTQSKENLYFPEALPPLWGQRVPGRSGTESWASLTFVLPFQGESRQFLDDF